MSNSDRPTKGGEMDTGLKFSRILKYESFVAFWLILVDGFAVVLWLYKFGLNPYRGIQGAGDLAGFVALLLFIPFSALEAIMILYEVFKERARQAGRREGRQEGRREGRREERQELRQGLTQMFAGDKDAMEKLDNFFNDATSTSQR